MKMFFAKKGIILMMAVIMAVTLSTAVSFAAGTDEGDPAPGTESDVTSYLSEANPEKVTTV